MSFVNFHDTVSPACAYALQNDIMISNSCGQADVGQPFNATRANTCVCNEMNPQSVWVYCAGDDQANWIDMYKSDTNEKVNGCKAVNLPVPSQTLLPLPAGTYTPTAVFATATAATAVVTGTATAAVDTSATAATVATTTAYAASAQATTPTAATTTAASNLYSGAAQVGASLVGALAVVALFF
ncbi:hypothetical protein HDU98_004842 [Podochytrium sp. JEL0797]|nr:hypothetical protein HDU98_004842 [Podochytrium sp. JEL0797]